MLEWKNGKLVDPVWTTRPLKRETPRWNAALRAIWWSQWGSIARRLNACSRAVTTWTVRMWSHLRVAASGCFDLLVDRVWTDDAAVFALVLCVAGLFALPVYLLVSAFGAP